jgi:hypothetical protein
MIPDVCDEVHGVNDCAKLSATASDLTQRVTVVARGQWISLNKTEGPSYPAGLSPAQARYIAQKLYRCAAIVEARRKAGGQP